MNQIKGRHIIIDAFECDPALLDNPEHLEQLLKGLVSSLGMELLGTKFHHFHPQGVTGVLLLSTSHFSVHTWPENAVAALDLFTCGDSDPAAEIDALLRGLAAKKALVYGLERSIGNTGTQVFWEMRTQEEKPNAGYRQQTVLLPANKGTELALDRGDFSDQIERRQLLANDHHMLFQGTSSFQRVELMEAMEMRMYLDGQLQFSSLDERIYHEALVHPAFSHTSSHERVLIVGGGDGLALREVLKYRDVVHVDLVDIDPIVLDVAKYVPKMAALNESSMHDPRLVVHPQDAVKFLNDVTAPYQIIIVDFPDPADEIISALYSREFFQRLSACLADDGVLVCQSFSPEDAPLVYWSIGLTMESAGLHTKAYHCFVPSFGDWGFHIAGRAPLMAEPEEISVPTQTLPANLSSLFSFSAKLLEKRQGALVNTLEDLTLHQFY